VLFAQARLGGANYVVQVLTLGGEAVAEVPVGAAGVIDWSRDGRSVLVSEGPTLKVFPLSGAPATILSVNYQWARFSSDGSRVVFVDSSPSYYLGPLRLASTDGGSTIELAESVGAGTVAFSSDGQRLAFWSFDGGSRVLNVMPPGGGPTVQLESSTHLSVFPSRPVFSSDGKKLLYDSPSGDANGLTTRVLKSTATSGGPPLPIFEGEFYVPDDAWLSSTRAWARRTGRQSTAFQGGLYFFDVP
jgi:Tol biopolymer transport system component